MIIADIGSTHGNDIDYFSRAIEFAKGRKNLRLKVQMFGADSDAAKSNVVLLPSVYKEAKQYADQEGVSLFASVFDWASYLECKDDPIIKFAYSMRNSPLLRAALYDHARGLTIVSYDWMDTPDTGVLSLLMPVPNMYPVLHSLDISEHWFERFDGLSDHTLGTIQSEVAIDCGAQVVEKHVKFDGYYDCPDAMFAIDEHELDSLLKYDSANNGRQ